MVRRVSSFLGSAWKIRSPKARSSTRLMPTSTTTAPGLTQDPSTSPGRPTAATSRSASRHRPGRSWVRLWAMVTVACSSSSIKAMGLPTISLRPSTTARLPFRAMP